MPDFSLGAPPSFLNLSIRFQNSLGFDFSLGFVFCDFVVFFFFFGGGGGGGGVRVDVNEELKFMGKFTKKIGGGGGGRVGGGRGQGGCE